MLYLTINRFFALQKFLYFIEFLASQVKLGQRVGQYQSWMEEF